MIRYFLAMAAVLFMTAANAQPLPLGTYTSKDSANQNWSLNSAAGTGGGVTATPANMFLNSLGINTHIDQGVSGASYTAPLQFLGVRNIRSGAGNLAELQTVHSQAGVKIEIFTNCDLPDMISFGQALAGTGALLALEGPNEPNNFPCVYNGQTGGGTGDWTPVANYQRDLYAAVKNPSNNISSFPVWGTSETGGEANNVGLQFTTIPTGGGTLFPDGTKFSDFVNIHNYVCSTQNFYGDNMAWFASDPLHIPTWDGLHVEVGVTWFGNFQGYTDTQLPTVPRVTTETGWSSDGTSAWKTQRIQGVVLVNNYLDQFARGWSNTFIYQVRDGEGGDNQAFGVFNSDSTPKLAATYIHNLTSILADTTNFMPGSLNYTVSNVADTTVHNMLLQKANHNFELVIWGESAAGSNPVTITFGSAQGTVKVYDVTSGTTPTQSLSNVSSVPLTMTDHAFIVEVVASGGTTVEIDDTDPSVIYSSPNSAVNSGWNLGNGNPADFNSTGHYTNFCVNPPQAVPIQGAMAVMNFNGTAVTLIGQTGSNVGIGAYAIDGVPVGTKDGYTPTNLHQQNLVTVTGLAAGSHVLSYAVTCNKNASATDFYQVIDAYKITGTVLPPSSGTMGGWNQVTTTGTWSSTTSNTDLSGGQLWSGNAGDSISWTFTGSLIEVFGRPDTGDGLFNVTIDGVQVATNVDEHYGVVDNDGLTAYMIYAKKLSSGGQHTIKLTATGTEDSLNGSESSGLKNLLQFDTFLAFP